jgi:monoamine oxidase
MTDTTSASPLSGPLDYVIVGAGVSGLYSAWRLLTDTNGAAAPPTVAILESGDRVGGRLLTWLPLGERGGLRAELGGMRFLESQELVWSLLHHLGFGKEIIDFAVSGPNLRLLLRGRSTPLDTPDPSARYAVPASDQGQAAGDLLIDRIKDVMNTDENRLVLQRLTDSKIPDTRQGWDTIKPYLTWRGQRLWDLGFWNILSEIFSSETYEFVVDALGYYSLAGNWNAAEAMQAVWLDFRSGTEYRTLARGYSSLPDQLAAEARAAGAKIALGSRVAGFQRSGDLWDVRLGGGDATIKARHLILAMPRRSLELLSPSGEFDLQGDRALNQLVGSITPQPAFKLFLFYERRWWDPLGIKAGRSVCDLPIRQTYYFSPDADGEQAGSSIGLLMASYNDARSVAFWQGLVPPRDEWDQGRAQLRLALNALGLKANLFAANARAEDVIPDPPPRLHKASEAMMRHAKAQLALLHNVPVDDIPDAHIGAFADWEFDPFGGGWNFWGPQVDVKSAMEHIKVPLGAGERLYVVGDAYSGAQGWVEGALTATEVTLEEHLGLRRPSWLPPDYYLGW